MTFPTPTTITITDRNETKFLTAQGFVGAPSPRDGNTLDFAFEATEALFEVRRAFDESWTDRPGGWQAQLGAIERVFRKARGLPENDDHHYFQEMIVNSDNLIHVFLRGKRQQQVACFVCRKGANLGMVLTKSRMAMPEIE